MPSIFTRIINREIPSKIVYETETVIAFHDVHPQAPVHVLIVPKKEIPTINDLSEETAHLIGELFLAAKKIALDFGVAESGYRVVMNCNEDGGQSVDHLHLHFLAGRSLKWPPG